MPGEVIHFPGVNEAATTVEEEVVRSPVALFEINERGQVDLAEGIAVTDAVTAFWEAVQDKVAQAWADHAVGREAARVRLLTAYLDKIRPEWREDLVWKV